MLRLLRLPFDGFAVLRRHSAAMLGAGCLDATRRRRSFACGSLGLVAVAWLMPPAIGLGVSVLTVWLLVAVYGTWVENEQQRGVSPRRSTRRCPTRCPGSRISPC